MHVKQDLCDKVGKIAERFDSLAASANVASSDVPGKNGGGLHCSTLHKPEEETLNGRRIKTARRKGVPLVGRRDTATACQASQVENPVLVMQESAGVASGASGFDIWQGKSVLLVRICGMLNIALDNARFCPLHLKFQFLPVIFCFLRMILPFLICT